MQAFEKSQSVLNVLATGLGKTIIFSHIAKEFMKSGRILVIAHREELIRQAHEKLEAICETKPEIEMADQWANRGFYKTDLIVSSVQTQNAGRNGGRMNDFDPNDFSLLIIDEAHHAPAQSYLRVIDYYSQNPNLKILGCTATPDRADELALGQIFDTVAYEYDIKDGISDGWLVPIEQQSVFVKGLDFSECRVTAGDLNGKDLAAIMEYEETLHGIATPCVDLCGNRKTLIFAASVAHAERLAEIINRHKPNSARYVCGTTPKDDRKQLFKDYRANRFQFLVNVGITTEGWDEPGVQIVVMARPTKSRCLYTQMAGRGTRALEGVLDGIDEADDRKRAIRESDKDHLTIIDFVGNCGRHKLVTSADVLGGRYSDEIVEQAKKNIEEKSAEKPVDVATELQIAEQEIKKRHREQEEALVRDKIKARAHYSTAKVNPFDVFDLEPHRERAWHKGRQPTMAQAECLKKAGVDIAGLSFSHAHQLIDELIQRQKKGMPTYKMQKHLRKSKMPNDITFEEAGVVMGMLAKQRWVPLGPKQREIAMQEIMEMRNGS
jgi:superfamily II DNA or RNA helicase